MLQFSVVKKLRNRLHVKVTGHHFTEAEAAYVEDTLFLNDAIVDVTFYTRSSQIAIKHTGDIDAVRDAVLGLRDLDLSEAPALNEYSPRLVNKKYREMMINRTALYLGKKAVLPATASAVMYLLGIGDILEEWTHRKSVLNLAQSMSLNVDKVWVLVDDIEVSKPVNEVVAGDQIIIRQGEVIPLDGVVIDGVVLVNESSMTGEPEAVRRDKDSSVYAGTVVEDGKAIVEVRSTSKTSRYEKIVNLIEESEQMKSGMEQQAYRMADKLVPISFIGAGLTYLLTRNVMKALSFVMVDFSCALKLSIPLSVLSAMQEASKRGITVKGGKFLEQIAQADMIVFDKTGTLTKAEPEFEQIIPFNGHDADEMLKLAACIEEHFPHSMAKAIVRAAKDHDLPHKEMHSDVEYVVAHGIASKVGRYRVRIGSAHYIFDDEKTKIPTDEQEKFNNLPNSSSHIYLAIGGTLAAVICIKDPVREEAKQVIADLHTLGIKKVVMMTGDSKR
ncbi:MAG: HAD-IC family P-type ATPase, partial [Veillonella sp.]|uniref:HAD-IC family P-type ATPase n=1 Tax=Veillonella sp. TaxID=1926307 RepID=UPI002580BA22